MKKNKRYIYLNLIFGLIWLAAGIFKVGVRGQGNWFGYMWFVLSAFYIGAFIYQMSKLNKKNPKD